jgi:predicted nucleic acid-binding protein
VILADTSIWVDHLRRNNRTLAAQLESRNILTHPFVIGELALGNLSQPGAILASLLDLPRTPTVSDEEMLVFIRRAGLAGAGIGLVDAHLLAATKLAAGALLWTTDTKLNAVAERLDLAASKRDLH